MLYSPNQTVAKLLVDFAEKLWITGKSPGIEEQKRYLMMHDLYTKARSYSILNKVAFWFALMLGIGVVVWPAIAVIAQDFGWEKQFLKSAIVQTTVTAFAGLTFTIYSHYKKRQVYVENLMRSIIYAEQWDPSIVQLILKEMERIDSGFGFSQVVGKEVVDKDVADKSVKKQEEKNKDTAEDKETNSKNRLAKADTSKTTAAADADAKK